MSPRIAVDRAALAEFCRRHHIDRLAFFGSVLRDDFGPDSDIDVLVEFETDHAPGWEIVSMERELSGLLGGRRVDLVTPLSLNHRMRDQVMRDAETLYVAAA
jgi:predicted nucleotidyltransferase